MFIVLKLAI